MKLLDLPSEILREIISLCGPGAVTETCRTFAGIAASTPALWTSVRLGPSQFLPDCREHLRRRLSRTANSLLTVSIGWVGDEGFMSPDLLPGGIIGDLCLILSDWSQNISNLQVNSETTFSAGYIMRTIFRELPSSVVFPALRSLSVGIERRDDDCNEVEHTNSFPKANYPRLHFVLEDSHKSFSCLQFLSIPTLHYNWITFSEHATFSHLHTLVLDGAQEKTSTNICRVTELLSNTPQLETLWLKDHGQFSDAAASNPVQNWEQYKDYRRRRPVHIFLPNLVRLAVSSPGPGSDLLYCLEAPSLEDLHLDGSRPGSFSWLSCYEPWVQRALKSFASRSSGLRRLAFTEVYLAQHSYEWLLFGDGGRPPFPMLETLAFHAEPLWEDLLLRFSQQPTIPLRRLVIPRCHTLYTFKESALVKMYQAVIANAPNERYELKIDRDQIPDKDSDTLEEMGVQMILSGEARMSEWWTLGHDVDASDSHVY